MKTPLTKIQKRIAFTLYAGLAIVATIYVWFGPDGGADFWIVPDGSNRIIIGPAPSPVPRPYPIVHPTIVPVGTPSPEALRRLPL